MIWLLQEGREKHQPIELEAERNEAADGFEAF
jgi:hypothetical protein